VTVPSAFLVVLWRSRYKLALRDMAAAKAFFESAKLSTGVISTAPSLRRAGRRDVQRAPRQKAATVRCAGSSAHDRLANSVAATTSCVTSSVPALEPISTSPPTAAGSLPSPPRNGFESVASRLKIQSFIEPAILPGTSADRTLSKTCVDLDFNCTRTASNRASPRNTGTAILGGPVALGDLVG
jgi:hypothetical protein